MSLEAKQKVEIVGEGSFEDMEDIVKTTQLDILKLRLERQCYPGYPAKKSRLVTSPAGLLYFGDRPLFPTGPWEINDHPNRKKMAALPSIEERRHFFNSGFELDGDGRPLHPWWREMITDPNIGVVTGPGFYYKYGPNLTADPIVISDGHLLLVKRKDTGDWGMPGGHVDAGEDPMAAARREATEETGVIIPEEIPGELVYQGPVADIRTTIHAWPETSAYLFILNGAGRPEPTGMDDAAEAAWVPLGVVLKEERLFGSHKFLLNRGLAHYLT